MSSSHLVGTILSFKIERGYLPEPVPANKNLFAGTCSGKLEGLEKYDKLEVLAKLNGERGLQKPNLLYDHYLTGT